jgi:hypothetical protein
MSKYSQIPRERWIANLVDVAQDIANKEHQEHRWLALDRYAWEGPSELICAAFDDYVIEGFIEEFSPAFSEAQRSAALGFRDELNDYYDHTRQNLDPAVVLADPRWEGVRQRAVAFVAAFRDKWP